MLAAVRSATLVGVDGQPVTVEVHVSSRAPRVPRGRVARHRGPRVARARARRAAVVAARVPDATHHRQPRAGRCAQVGLRASSSRSRSGSRPPPTSFLPACSMPSPCSASSVSTARCARCRARSRSSTRSRAAAPDRSSCRWRTRRRPRWCATCGCAPRATSSSSAACLKGEEEWPSWDDRRARRRRSRRRVRRRTRRPRARCAGSPSPGARSRSRPPEPTTCSSSGRREQARRCWPDASSPCSRRSSTRKRSKSPASTPPPAKRSADASSRRDRCGHRTTPRPPLPSSEAAAPGCGPAKSRSRTGDCSFSTSSASSRPRALDALRQPLEERVVRISRQARSLTFPASFQLVACTNPCPCGLGEPNCRCSEPQRVRYRRRLSAPFLDRFDLRRAGHRARTARSAGRVVGRRRRARARGSGTPAGALRRLAVGAERVRPCRCRRPAAAARSRRRSTCGDDLIEGRVLTGRGASRLRRVARTLADLDDATRDHACAPRERRTPPERHMTGPRTSTRLDPVELAAAILACLPDMTPGRLRGLSLRWGGPIGALAAVQRGLATGVLCQYARAEDIPARVALARLWQQVVGNDARARHVGSTPDTRVRRRSRRVSHRRRPARPTRGAVGRGRKSVGVGGAACGGGRHACGHAARARRRARDRGRVWARPASPW